MLIKSNTIINFNDIKFDPPLFNTSIIFTQYFVLFPPKNCPYLHNNSITSCPMNSLNFKHLMQDGKSKNWEEEKKIILIFYKNLFLVNIYIYIFIAILIFYFVTHKLNIYNIINYCKPMAFFWPRFFGFFLFLKNSTMWSWCYIDVDW